MDDFLRSSDDDDAQIRNTRAVSELHRTAGGSAGGRNDAGGSNARGGSGGGSGSGESDCSGVGGEHASRTTAAATSDGIDADDSTSTSTTPTTRRLTPIEQLLCGGLAGATAKSVIAPADRVKILYVMSVPMLVRVPALGF
jgi:hypothetical protein